MYIAEFLATVALTALASDLPPAYAGITTAPSDVDMVLPAEHPEQDLSVQSKPADQWTGVWTRSNLLGDMGGLRSRLGRSGITVGLTETSDELVVLQGGIQPGQAYHGLTTLTLGLDTAQAGGWAGGNFNVSVLNIHGQSFSANYVGSLQTASGTEADAGVRLWEAWFQQKIEGVRTDVRVGQQSIDQEFMVSQYAGVFMGTMFGWPGVPSYDMQSGGPAYPLSALGARLRTSLGHGTTLLAGVYAGDPANAPGAPDPQKVNDTGTTFSLSGGTLYIAEVQFGHNQPELGDLDTGHNDGLPGTYKLGFWYEDARFSDTGLDSNGLSLANPASNGRALQHSGNYSVYAVADQMIWREAEDSTQTLNVFARLMAAPEDRNTVSLSANLGITLTAPLTGRDNDVAGFGLAYVQVGNHAMNYDRANNAYSASNLPVRDSETFAEVTYQYQVTPWWQMQGSLQYTLTPGAGVTNPVTPNSSSPIPDAWVLGLRTNITF
jgi:porin